MSVTQLEPSDLIEIPGGEFRMGQEDGRAEERPVHRVRLSPFRLCRYQVTNAHWQTFRKATMREKLKSEFGGATHPVTSVNWFDATVFCHWLAQEWKMPVRLPAEAEWEFAARGGAEQKLYPWGDAGFETRKNYASRWHDGQEPVAT